MGGKLGRLMKAAGQEDGSSPQRQTPTKERSVMFRTGDPRTPPPYERRVGMLHKTMLMVKQGKRDEAKEMLKTLQQDLGLESLDNVFNYRNLVDPISHDLISSLVKYIHCPEEDDALDKVCRQLKYHLGPHSQWKRQGLLKTKPQACLKSVLSNPPSDGTIDLFSIPLVVTDMERLRAYLEQHSADITNLGLAFTELTDEAFLLILPTVASLPQLTTLVLSGNRLTRAVLKDLTDTLKKPNSFLSINWIDLGNNVDITYLPQAYQVGLRKKKRQNEGHLSTIQESSESQASEPEIKLDEDDAEDTNRTESLGELRSEVGEEIDGDTEINNMMEELLYFDKEVQGKDEDDSMWTLEEQRLVSQRKEKMACKAEGEEDLHSQSSLLSCSSQSQHSSGAIEPLREDSVPDQLACNLDNPT